MPYLTAAGIEACMQWLANTYPQICQLLPVPETSIEGRPIHLVKIARGGAANRRGVLFTGGVHAREVVPPDALVSFALKLCSAYTNGTDLSFGPKVYSNLDVQLVVDVLDTFILPLVNPDGRTYVQAAGGDPWWRKNRNPNPGQACMGVDVNRNYDFLWSSGIGTSASACSDVFKGTGAFSEPETRNVRSVLDANPHIVSMMDVHSYSQLVLHPWGDDDNQTSDPAQNFLNPAYNGVRGVPGDMVYREYIPPDDINWFVSTGNAVRDAIAAVRGSTYTVEQGIRLYPTTGTGGDYGYVRHFADPTKHRVYSYTLETGLEFQPTYSEALNIISEVSSGLFQFCLSALCVVESMVSGTALFAALGDLRAFRREIETSEAGRSYVRMFDRLSPEIMNLMLADEALRRRALAVLEAAYSIVRTRHLPRPATIDARFLREVDALLKALVAKGSPELVATVTEFRGELRRFEGKTAREAVREARPINAIAPLENR